MLINGKSVADVVMRFMHENKIRSVKSFLKMIDQNYENKRMDREFDEIIYI